MGWGFTTFTTSAPDRGSRRTRGSSGNGAGLGFRANASRRTRNCAACSQNTVPRRLRRRFTAPVALGARVCGGRCPFAGRVRRKFAFHSFECAVCGGGGDEAGVVWGGSTTIGA